MGWEWEHPKESWSASLTDLVRDSRWDRNWAQRWETVKAQCSDLQLDTLWVMQLEPPKEQLTATRKARGMELVTGPDLEAQMEQE
jgi:hypothetical protein